jgi:Uma2 family endonuclease
MTTVTLPFVQPAQTERTLAALLDELGNISPNRILLKGPLGKATEQDVLDVDNETGLAPELIDGVLVEKAVGYLESLLAVTLGSHLVDFVRSKKLGIVLGEGGTLRILPGQVRIPDVCFVSRDRLPDGKLPEAPIPGLVPDLAIEILSASNTPGEMRRKLREYFEAGVRLVWYIDPPSRTAIVYTAIDQCQTLAEEDELDGGDVLPGFRLPLGVLFGELDS